MNKTLMLRFFAGLGALGVGCGAFGAHALQGHFSNSDLEVWKTASFYLFVHILAGIISLVMHLRQRVAYCFLIGSVLFSFSLYALVLTGFKILGAVTPFGGSIMILGWIFMAIDIRNVGFQKEMS